MRTIAVANQKGGCGKTTVSINLAACLAREGRRTLLVDMDPQGHCALGLAVPEEQIEVSIHDVLTHRSNGDRVDMVRSIWQITANFDLAPSTTSLASFEPAVQGRPDWEDRLNDALSSITEKYDFAIIDCPPHIGTLTYNALNAAGEVIVPVDTGYFSLQGLSKQLEVIETLRTRRESPLEIRVLANLYDVRTKLGREILNELKRKYGPLMCHTFINFNTKLREGASFGQPITEYDPGSMGFRDFVRLARELISAGGPDMVPTTLLRQADNLAERAERLLATSVPLFGEKGMQPLPARNGDGRGHGHGISESRSELPATGEPVTATAPAREPVADRPNSGHTGTAVAEPPKQLANATIAAKPTVDSTVVTERYASTRPATHEEIQKKIDRIYGVRSTSDGVLFVAHAPGAGRVCIAGDFNGWSSEATPMLPAGNNGVFRALLPLSPGRYQYRYVVDGDWKPDPHNDAVEFNPFGEPNSVIHV